MSVCVEVLTESALKQKHSKAGEETRFQGTVLGIPAEHGPIKIEGGPPSIQSWKQSQAARRQQAPQSPSLLSSTEPLLLWPDDANHHKPQQLLQNHEPPTKKLRAG
jgi:hypothetical protein